MCLAESPSRYLPIRATSSGGRDVVILTLPIGIVKEALVMDRIRLDHIGTDVSGGARNSGDGPGITAFAESLNGCGREYDHTKEHAYGMHDQE